MLAKKHKILPKGKGRKKWAYFPPFVRVAQMPPMGSYPQFCPQMQRTFGGKRANTAENNGFRQALKEKLPTFSTKHPVGNFFCRKCVFCYFTHLTSPNPRRSPPKRPLSRQNPPFAQDAKKERPPTTQNKKTLASLQVLFVLLTGRRALRGCPDFARCLVFCQSHFGAKSFLFCPWQNRCSSPDALMESKNRLPRMGDVLSGEFEKRY